ncbi:(2E,6E)-farnesyl diphosphate synthase [Idiomarina sp. OT37-5b]|mgnify:FL=1|uniref:(2E,6E)-farnesyl diphosphate synthase n=1 Tax=Idiomarina sp. OT37-5b TaxID=2100422 RepID=UPI000CF8B71A|nr:farnesyl diphosphate synthase [Idiomarina sp. OT37-5b]AVJ56779.1 (2E,6E)-farnesyl diphosphate synthase [Idiomarina sp. OT37-5b]
MSIKAVTEAVRSQVDAALEQRLREASIDASLADAMRYGALLGGKRIRPYLTLTIADICSADKAAALDVACAVECIHAYSLIHDDLPAMDDDDLRRGKPTCHIAFDEATAILAGDALQTLAFELLSAAPLAAVPAQRQLEIIRILAAASGGNGMCGGQALDLAATHQSLSESALERVHRHKTGALIRASAELGVLCGKEQAQPYRSAFAQFADALGLAFQIQDDILDVTASTETLGKPQGSDEQAEKSTYVKLLGLDGARQKLLLLHQQALQSLADIPYNTQQLEQFSTVLLTRDH